MPDAENDFDAHLEPVESPSLEGQEMSHAESLPEDDRFGGGTSASREPEAEVSGGDDSEVWSESESDPGQNEIEEAYQKALAVLEDAGWELDPSDTDSPADPSRPFEGADSGEANVQATAGLNGSIPGADLIPGIGTAHTAGTRETTVEASARGDGPRLAAGTERHAPLDELEHSNVTPAQVIEAALFVGGTPLTSRKIGALLRNSFDVEFVERTIDELNEQYIAEGRPYEIRLGEGGHRLELRPEYEKLRQRAYGSGPREVKLSQDVLEVLALVAYQQPISQDEVESHGKQSAGNLLRQLLRRDLVAIQRGEGGRKDVRYVTTPRFLAVFGIGSLDELPQPDDLARK